MLKVDCEPPVLDTCSCCGKPGTRLTRFVYREGDAYAIYYAAFSEQHPPSYVDVLVGVGDWAEDALSTSHVSFYLRICSTPAQFEVTVCDDSESPWGEIPFVGRTLSRKEALAHAELPEIFQITDYMVTKDAPVVEYLSHAPQRA
jgi:hypothetical protein